VIVTPSDREVSDLLNVLGIYGEKIGNQVIWHYDFLGFSGTTPYSPADGVDTALQGIQDLISDLKQPPLARVRLIR
jgi:hypothetical protein